MRVFKFGGASIKDSSSIKMFKDIICYYTKKDACLIVIISAMGKTTNMLEQLVHLRLQNSNYTNKLNEIKKFHLEIINELNNDKFLLHSVINPIFEQLEKELLNNPLFFNTDEYYDRIVSFGELLSTSIISSYLNSNGINNKLLNSQKLIKTDSNYRNAGVLWYETQSAIKDEFTALDLHSLKYQCFIAQGFIGSNIQNHSTTLGREGSDFSASIYAWALDASEMIIWKDVPGVLNADPKFFNDTVKLDFISYKDAIELAYYGASVIHPKTIQPLQNKKIPLYIKPFYDYKSKGTKVFNYKNKVLTPCFICKQNQILISISPKNFSFIAEQNLHFLFQVFDKFKVKINLMQNSAISFSVCCDYNEINIKQAIEALNNDYIVKYNQQLELITIRYYNNTIIDKILNNRKIILEQRSRSTAQIVVKQNK